MEIRTFSPGLTKIKHARCQNERKPDEFDLIIFRLKK